jgi:DNA-binding PadR family transcriptional regulator
MIESGRDRTIGVPRGLLRFIVLSMLSEKPMAGAEIAEEIEVQTNGRWKPSPGSIYPLLASMLKKGFTKELPKNTEGFKRYSFTPIGYKFLEKQIALGRDFVNKLEFLVPLLIGGLQLGPNQEKFCETREPARKLLQAFITLNNNLDKLSATDATEIAEALRDCSKKLEKIAQKLKNEIIHPFGL